MRLLEPGARFLLPLLLVLAISAHALKGIKARKCKGGSIYFAAHPSDMLLYQNPDLFHDLYVWKCTTAVLFTSGDRGVLGNYSRTIERGFEDALAWMATAETDGTAWSGVDVQFSGKVVLLRWLQRHPQTQILYLRLPDGRPDGSPYREGGESLKALYDGSAETITSTDGSATYTLESLKELLATVLRQREPNDVRILEHRGTIPRIMTWEHDHTDHLVSSRLVAEVVDRENITANLVAYGTGKIRHLEPTVHEDYVRVKIDAFMKYATYDRHVCRGEDECVIPSEDDLESTHPDNDDTGYIMKWMEREYYVK